MACCSRASPPSAVRSGSSSAASSNLREAGQRASREAVALVGGQQAQGAAAVHDWMQDAAAAWHPGRALHPPLHPCSNRQGH